MTTETTVEQTASTPVPVETTASTTVDTSKETTSATAETPADAAAKADATKKGISAKDRINQLTREKHQLRNEKSELEKRLEEVERRTQPQEPKRPNVDDYGTTAEFNQALDKYVADKTAFDSTQNRQKETQEQTAQRKRQESAQASQKFVTDLARDKANYEGIEAAFAEPAFGLIVKAMPEEIVTLIEGSDKNVDIAYYLATNLDEAERIASLNPILAAREITLIESRLEKPKPKTVSTAPPPVKPVQANSTKEVDISDPNISEAEFSTAFRKARKARKAGG